MLHYALTTVCSVGAMISSWCVRTCPHDFSLLIYLSCRGMNSYSTYDRSISRTGGPGAGDYVRHASCVGSTARIINISTSTSNYVVLPPMHTILSVDFKHQWFPNILKHLTTSSRGTTYLLIVLVYTTYARQRILGTKKTTISVYSNFIFQSSRKKTTFSHSLYFA